MRAGVVGAAGWPLAAGSDRRRAARLLLAFGVSGLALLVLSAGLVIGALGALAEAAGTIDAQRARLVALIDPTEAVLDRAAGTSANAGTSLQASAGAARDGAVLSLQLADAMEAMARAAQVDVLGVRPFSGIADELSAVAASSRTLATNLDATAGALDVNFADSRSVARDLGTLADQLARLRTELDATTAAGVSTASGPDLPTLVRLARLVLLGLLAWLAIPAVLAIWLGWRFRRG
ncbi:MAG: hypothetical protein EPO36_13900 [Chloroflexota bacterium]|nr:MAG: hypothetical protein EPO36_13900 [Chloroflexota bacterium]